MTTPATIRAYGQKYGIRVDIGKDGRCYEAFVWSPDNRRFAVRDLHGVCLIGDGWFTKPNWDNTLKELKELVAEGFTVCGAECDICNE